MSDLASRLKELRKQHGMTQEELAKELGMSTSAIALYETKKRKPDPETLNKFADFFQVSTDYLLGRTDNPQAYPSEFEDLETVALHRMDDYTKDLPYEAKKQLNDIIMAYLKSYPKKDSE